MGRLALFNCSTLRVTPALFLLIWMALPASGIEFFVSSDREGAGDGTRARPFGSLEAARDAVRKLDKAAVTGEITIWLLGGTYLREGSFELTAADRGSPGTPIVYRAVGDGPVRLLGGRILKGFGPVEDGQIRDRFQAAARNHIVQVDVGALPATREAMASRGFGRPTVPSHPELFFHGQPMPLARWPNGSAWERIAGSQRARQKGTITGAN